MSVKLAALVAVALALLAAAILAIDVAPLDALRTLIDASFGSARAVTGTIRETAPLLVAGLAVFLALRAGLFNIGVEGQLLVGALACTSVALQVPGPVGLVLGTIVGVAAGALWALPAGLIKAYRGGHEVITTIMLNNVAALATTALVAGPLKAPGQDSATTRSVESATRLPNVISVSDLTLNAAVFAGLLLLAALAFWLRGSVGGYELRAVGANARAAQLAGVSSRRVITWTMAASGALGGLAGSLQVLAYEGRFYSGFSPGYGFDALGVALLAGASVWGVLPAALLFGALAKGGPAVQILGVPKGITGVVLGLLILVFAAVRFRRSPCPQ